MTKAITRAIKKTQCNRCRNANKGNLKLGIKHCIYDNPPIRDCRCLNYTP